jgi:hypothetical protein
MSSIVIAGNTSGAITIAAPAEAGLNTLTLPASTGTVALTSTAVQTHLTTTSSQSNTASVRTNILGLNATITPSTTSKRVKITIRWNGEHSNTSAHNQVFGIKRDTTDIGNPAASGSLTVGMAIVAMGYYAAEASTTPDSATYIYIDSPATTSATTYHATYLALNGGTLYNQRTVLDSGTAERLTSNIILEEID